MCSVHSDSDLAKKTKKSCEKFTENIYLIGNEPTLACYRIQEHVHKSGQMICEKGNEMRKVSKQLKSCCDGLDYSIRAIKAMEGSRTHLQNVATLITNSLFFKQQLDYECSRMRTKSKDVDGSTKSVGIESSSPSSSASPSQPVTSPQPMPPLRSSASSSRSKFAQRLSGSFDFVSNLTFSSLTSSTSQDFKDIKSVFSQMTSQSSPNNARRPHPESTPGTGATKSEEPPSEDDD